MVKTKLLRLNFLYSALSSLGDGSLDFLNYENFLEDFLFADASPYFGKMVGVADTTKEPHKAHRGIVCAFGSFGSFVVRVTKLNVDLLFLSS